MGHVRIDPGLEPERRIFRRISFYELVDLLKSSQLLLPLPPPQAVRRRGRQAPVACQSWAMDLDDEAAFRHGDDGSGGDPAGICLVSSVRALSGALPVDGDVRLSIERSDAAAGRLSLIARPHPPEPPAAGEDGLRVWVDLGSLLTGVLVSSDAPRRFLDLVSSLVQDRIWVSVGRAEPAPQASRPPAAAAGAPRRPAAAARASAAAARPSAPAGRPAVHPPVPAAAPARATGTSRPTLRYAGR